MNCTSLRLLLLVLVLTPAFLRAADEKDGKAKEKDKEKAKDEKEILEWTTLLTVANEPGGNKHFDLAKNGKVKFTWDTSPNGQVPQFRVTVAKLNDRNGNYQIFATITSVFGASKDSTTLNLGAGKYRLYVATKFMKYTLKVETPQTADK